MKKMILTVMLFISMGTIAFAQQQDYRREFKTVEERAKRSTDLLAKKLSLTEEQKKEAYAINLDNLKKIEVERKRHKQANKELLRENMKERDEKINDLLTDTQKSAYKELKKERFQERKHRGDSGVKESL